MKTLGIVQSGDAAGSGSSAVTSSAAAQILPASIVLMRTVSSATLPRATFTNIDEGFMAAKAASLISPVVSGVSAQVSATMSACGTSFTRSPMPWISSAPLVPALGSRRMPITFMSKALASLARWLPMRPMPTTSSVLPPSSSSRWVRSPSMPRHTFLCWLSRASGRRR